MAGTWGGDHMGPVAVLLRSVLLRTGLLVLMMTAMVPQGRPQPGSSIASIESTFQSPPDDARLMMRWWWFGPAITQPELLREMEQMKAAGIGGFEIQPVYPLSLDQNQAASPQTLPYLSSAFLDDLRFVNIQARQLGLRVSLTLSSGWPYGGPHTTVDEAAGSLHFVQSALSAGATSATIPAMEDGEALLAVFLATAEPKDSASAKPLILPTPAPGRSRIDLAPATHPRTLLWFLDSRTGQQVKRPAVGAEGFVLDHFSRAAVEHHLRDVADPLLASFGDLPPYSVFSDSLEVYGSDWTPHLLDEFKQRRGYDLLPHLPELVSGTDDEALSVRHDWGLTLTELIDENYLKPIASWAAAHHTLFRSQTYGDPAVSLSSNALVDLPEGEGPQWKRFSYTRWATSASHLYGRPVTSAETWTWLDSPAFRATPLDMKAEADRFFLEGVNQFVGHGWPYSPPSAGEPGWRFYAAGAFNTHNPWWFVMPEVTKYLQRTSWILRQGHPANDIALYLPEDDAYAAFTSGKVSLSDLMPRWITPELTAAIEDAGYNFDYIDSAAIAARGIPYAVLILPNVDRIAPATLERIASYERQGGKVIALGRLPAHAPGLVNFARESALVETGARALFASSGEAHQDAQGAARFLSDLPALGQTLHALLPPDLELAQPAPDVGFLHRRLDQADIYFVANTGNEPVHLRAHFRSRFKRAEWLDPETGGALPVNYASDGLLLDLEPYASRILLLQGGASTPAEPVPPAATLLADISHDWQVSFDGQPTIQMADLISWTALAPASSASPASQPATLYYSGVATYRRSFTLPARLEPGARIILSFGEGQPIADPATNPNHPGMRALLDPPIREAAEVYVNGHRAGALWHPPYTLDITAFCKPGGNDLAIRVGNTAINELAGQSPATYRLLDDRYGFRFQAQDMDHLQPLPSGLLGPVQVLIRAGPR